MGKGEGSKGKEGEQREGRGTPTSLFIIPSLIPCRKNAIYKKIFTCIIVKIVLSF
jgi:hypothetical protein